MPKKRFAWRTLAPRRGCGVVLVGDRDTRAARQVPMQQSRSTRPILLINFASAVGILESKCYDRMSGRQVGEYSPGPGEGNGELRSRITRPHCFSVYQAAAHGWGVRPVNPGQDCRHRERRVVKRGRKVRGLGEESEARRECGTCGARSNQIWTGSVCEAREYVLYKARGVQEEGIDKEEEFR